MNTRPVAITVLTVGLLGACAATPAQEEQEPQPSLGQHVVMGITEILVSAAFDGAFSGHERHEHARKSRAHAPAPMTYTASTTHRAEAPGKKPVSLKKREGAH